MSSFGIGKILAIIALLGVLGIGAWIVLNKKPQSPGASAFDAANSQITTRSAGTAHGNNADAQRLAGQFAVVAKELRDAGFTKNNAPKLSVTGGEFVTYCQSTDEALVFLVHVPDLRKFTSDAQVVMGELFLAAAQQIAAKRQPAPKEVAVGLRGAVMYDRVLVAPLNGSATTTEGASSTSQLHRFFQTPAGGAKR